MSPFTENIFCSKSGSLFLISSKSCNKVYFASSIIFFSTFSGKFKSLSVSTLITFYASSLKIAASSHV